MSKRKDLILKKLEGVYKEHLKLLEFLLQDEDDVEFFEKEYEYSKLDPVSIIYDFRFQERFVKSIGKDEFIKRYGENKKAALELLFQEPLTKDDVDLFVQAGKPLGEVYALSTKHPHLQLHSLLKFWEFVKNKGKVSSFADGLDDWSK